jgi:hypothetical protein
VTILRRSSYSVWTVWGECGFDGCIGQRLANVPAFRRYGRSGLADLFAEFDEQKAGFITLVGLSTCFLLAHT